MRRAFKCSFMLPRRAHGRYRSPGQNQHQGIHAHKPAVLALRHVFLRAQRYALDAGFVASFSGRQGWTQHDGRRRPFKPAHVMSIKPPCRSNSIKSNKLHLRQTMPSWQRMPLVNRHGHLTSRQKWKHEERVGIG